MQSVPDFGDYPGNANGTKKQLIFDNPQNYPMTDQSAKDDSSHIKLGSMVAGQNNYEYTLSKFYSSSGAQQVDEDRCIPFEETESPVKKVTAQSSSTECQGERYGLLQSLKKCGDTFSPRRS